MSSCGEDIAYQIEGKLDHVEEGQVLYAVFEKLDEEEEQEEEEEEKTYTVDIEDASVASCVAEGKALKFTGLKEGQTSAVVTSSGGDTFNFTVTVRSAANSNGWL